jgi:magnesium-transporting ATPase (P-type)
MFRYPTYASFLNTSLSEGNEFIKLGEGFENGCHGSERARMLEFSVNSKQMIAIVWTLISIALSLSVGISMGFSIQSGLWQLPLGMFFVLLLIMILPVYLFIALWEITASE